MGRSKIHSYVVGQSSPIIVFVSSRNDEAAIVAGLSGKLVYAAKNRGDFISLVRACQLAIPPIIIASDMVEKETLDAAIQVCPECRIITLGTYAHALRIKAGRDIQNIIIPPARDVIAVSPDEAVEFARRIMQGGVIDSSRPAGLAYLTYKERPPETPKGDVKAKDVRAHPSFTAA